MAKANSKKIKLNRKVSAFLLCLVIAVVFWLFSALSKFYSADIELPVKYVNIPVSRTLNDKTPTGIIGKVRASGFKLIKYKLGMVVDTISIDVSSVIHNSKSDQLGYIVSAGITDKIGEQLKSDIRLFRIDPDTIFISFEKTVSKKVPVVSNVKLSFEEQYRSFGDIVLSPDSVTVYGGEEAIRDIRSIKTKAYEFSGLNASIHETLQLDVSEKEAKDIKFSAREVKATLVVKQFTEKDFELPIELVNQPKDLTIKLFPSKIRVKFILPLDSFEMAKPSLFNAVVDASGVLNSQSTSLPVTMQKKPSWIENLFFTPTSVEYIIKADQ